MLRSILFLLCLPVWVNGAALDPSWKFKVLRSEHFELIYREDQKEIAKRYIVAAEQAHELIFPIFKEGPHKTIIVIMDETDQTNGMANFIPYPHITVYPVQPSTLDSIDEFGDWPLEMMVHEYTHILNMYPAHGFYVPLKWIFGSVVRPNAILPKWYLEGLAVNLESWMTTHGRLRSPDTHAAARALTLGKKFAYADVASINESGLTSWPYGGRPYMFGGWWWENAHRQGGPELIEKWNQNFSRRLPFFLNGPIQEQTKKSVHEFTMATNDYIENQGRKQIGAIEASGPHQSQALAEDKGEQSIFAMSPSGNRFVYWLASPSTGAEVRVKERSTPKQRLVDIGSRRIFKSVGTLKARFLNEDVLVFDRLDIEYPYGTYRDLFKYDFTTQEVSRLTVRMRAQEPSPSPTGKYIAYIQADAGKNRLNLLDLETGKSRTLLNGKLDQRLSMPEFLNETTILFSVRQKSGQERLHEFNLSTNKAQPYGAPLLMAQNPRVVKSGVLITDASTGARNVYLLKDGKAQAVSNTLTDIQTADLDPQTEELIVSELTAEGRRIKSFPLSSFEPPTLELAQIPPPPKAQTSKVKIREENYVPVAYMLPRYWIPFIYQVEEGYIFQGLTGNQDPAGRNEYSLMGAYDTVTKKPSFGASLVNHSFATDIGLSYAKSVSYLGASALTLESQSAALNFGNYWPFNSRFKRWSLGGQWIETESAVAKYRRIGPELSFVYSRLQSPLNEKWGAHFELAHQEYVKQDDYLDYGRTYMNFATQYSQANGRRWLLQTRGSLAPNLPHGSTIIALGDRNVGGNYLVNLANSQFMLRGYPSGTFVGRKMVNANLEYIFPAKSLDKGFGTFPLYLRNLELAGFVDTLSVDGAGFETEAERYKFSTLSEFYTGAGAELRINTTTAYHLPLSLTVGLYYGFNERFGGGFSPFIGIGFGGLEALENKTP